MDKKENTLNIKGWFIGTVKFFDQEKGFGFIKCYDDSEDYFVHVTKVVSGDISDSDIVLFRLKDSRKKPGTLESTSVTKLEDFRGDQNILKDKLSISNQDSFHSLILKRLTDDELTDQIVGNLNKFGEIDTEESYRSIIKHAVNYVDYLNSEESKIQAKNKISTSLEKNASEHFKMKFWLNHKLIAPPEQSIIERFFVEGSKELREKILNQLKSTSAREKLIKNLYKNEDPKTVLDVIILHLRNINNIKRHVDGRFFDKEIWDGKVEYHLFLEAVEYYKDNLSNPELFDLYLWGYINHIPISIILDQKFKLNCNYIIDILQGSDFSSSDLLILIKELFEVEKELFLEESKKGIHRYRGVIIHWNNKLINPIEWLTEQASNALPKKEFNEFESYIFDSVGRDIYLELWEKGTVGKIDNDQLQSVLTSNEDGLYRIESWINNRVISNEEAVSLLKTALKQYPQITTRVEYRNFYGYINLLDRLGENVIPVKEYIEKGNYGFFDLIMWLDGKSEELYFDLFQDKLIYLQHSHQVHFIKRLFKEADEGKFNLSVMKLTQLTDIDLKAPKSKQIFNNLAPFDISLNLVINALVKFNKEGKFLLENEVLKTALKNLAFSETHKPSLHYFFEQCEGRMIAKYNFNRVGEVKKAVKNGKTYIAIEIKTGLNKLVRGKYGPYNKFIPNSNFENLVNQVKKLPGRKWNDEDKHWGVPVKYWEEVKEFAIANNLYLDLEGSPYSNNPHMAHFVRDVIPNGVKYCEGRAARRLDKKFDVKFWWCNNMPCYQNCETLHGTEDWENYTLLDFCNIMGLDLDYKKKNGELIDKGKYYHFIVLLNRFERLLERLYCNSCDHVLYPVEDSNFAHYRVTRFYCENKSCNQHHNEVYLHHCLNSKCNSVIDSRVSKKCPNGLYICENEECGSCCSHDMLSRRLDGLRSSGGYIHEDLVNAVENRLGHLERGIKFCYECGDEMEDFNENKFKCDNCNITYDIVQ
ncbi:MAG: cold shock domain-containing protein [Balneolaceae bacterium]|nr:cold shock domain-containing protein [Balneolaceae bacterium]